MSENAEAQLVRLTVRHPSIWVLEIRNGVDNRLSDVVCTQLLVQLENVERQWRQRWAVASQLASTKERMEQGSGALIIIGALEQDKFFSNGFIWERILAEPGFIQNYFAPIMVKLLTFPVPTIASLNGHTFAGGFVLAMCCDYRVMNAGKAWARLAASKPCYLLSVHFGASYPHNVAALLLAKVKDPVSLRKVSEGHRWTPQELLKAKLIDEAVSGRTAEVLEAALTLAERLHMNASGGSYGLIKRELYHHTIEEILTDIRSVRPSEAMYEPRKQIARL